jgi:hypothetical protein
LLELCIQNFSVPQVPCLFGRQIHNHLIPMPRLDRGKVFLATTESAQLDFSGTRSFILFGVSFTQLLLAPLAVASPIEKKDAFQAGGYDFIRGVIVKIDDQKVVQ